ncbi:hypothetical protein C8R45DRAFT_814333 [Mycena sanguinolenta]|nr:hypothetical protein C8R45DRAFT_814333 [Mycena sanguinolenta]
MASAEEKYELIARGLHEVIGGDILRAILAEGRSPKGYLGAYSSSRRHSSAHLTVSAGTAPTGRREYDFSCAKPQLKSEDQRTSDILCL